MPPIADKPSKSTGRRSRKGCWTCKERHKKCDETRPICQRCAVAGITCQGYGVQLTWGTTTAISTKPDLGGLLLLPKRTNKRKRPSEGTLTTSPESEATFSPTSTEGQQPSPETQLSEFWSSQAYDGDEIEDPKIEERLLDNCRYPDMLVDPTAANPNSHSKWPSSIDSKISKRRPSSIRYHSILLRMATSSLCLCRISSRHREQQSTFCNLLPQSRSRVPPRLARP